MGKTVRRFMQNDIWNLGRNESWFSDMAEKGLYLRRIGPVFASFEKGDPQKIKYRIDVISTAPTEEQLEIYRESGWQLAASRKELYIFFSPEGANAPELHTDPMEQSYTLEALNRQMRNQVIALSVIMVFFFAIMLSMFFLERTPTLAMLDSSGVQRPLLVLVEAYVFYVFLRNFILLRRLKKSLSEGRPVDHRESWRKPRLINGFISVFIILVALLTACIPAAEIVKSRSYTLPESSADLPVIRLADIENNPALERESLLEIGGVDWGNSVRYDWSPLSPVKYEISEHGIVRNEIWEDGSGSYSPSIETQYFKLIFPSMADRLIYDLVERNVDGLEPELTVLEPDPAPFDKLVVAQSGIMKKIFAASGKEVIYISYYGNTRAEDVIALLPQIFDPSR